jgi:sodium transport system ATP-binding protein
VWNVEFFSVSVQLPGFLRYKNPVIEVVGLSKVFVDKKTGPKKAVDGVSFTARPGEIFGLLGANGAGKTTTLRLLATILTPSSGTARIDGHDIVKDSQKVRERLGYLTGSAGVYERLTARQVLHYFGELYGMDPAQRTRRIAELTETLELAEFLDRRCDKLSTGQKQRVSIAHSVLHDPPVLFFDEPTSGLDVMAARTVVRFIKSCRELGKTVLFSTHIMSEVEALCDRIAVIHDGRVFADGTLEELRAQTGAQAFETVFLRLIGVNE